MKNILTIFLTIVVAIIIVSCNVDSETEYIVEPETECVSDSRSVRSDSEFKSKKNIAYDTETETEKDLNMANITEDNSVEIVIDPDTGLENNDFDEVSEDFSINNPDSVFVESESEKELEFESEINIEIKVTDEPDQISADTELETETEIEPEINTESVPIKYHSHKFTRNVKKEVTCFENGTALYECECGESYTEDIPATGKHIYESKIEKEPTCGTEGIKIYTCKVCGHTETEKIAKTGSHKYSLNTEKKATCSSEGEKTYVCSVCGDSYIETIPKNSHNYTEKITKEPTCSEEGIRTFTCSVCGASYTESIAKTEHNYVEVDRTVDTIGNDNEIHLKNVIIFRECSVCGAYKYDDDDLANEKAWQNEIIDVFRELYKTENKYKVFEYYCKYIENFNFPTVNKNTRYLGVPRGSIWDIIFSDNACYTYPFDIEKIRADLNGFAEYIGVHTYSTNIDSFGDIINEDNGTWKFPKCINNYCDSTTNYRSLVTKLYSDIIDYDLTSCKGPCLYIYFKPTDNYGEYWVFFIVC